MKIIIAAMLLISTSTFAQEVPKPPINPFLIGPFVCLPIDLVKQVLEQQAKEIADLKQRLAEKK